MANEFVARKGLISSGSVSVSGSVSASYFIGDGSQLINLPNATIGITIDTYTFEGNGLTNNFILSQSYDSSSLIVSVGGLSQTNVSDYSVSGQTLSFVVAPTSQSNILVKAFVNSSQNVSGSFTGAFFGNISSATSASYSATASYALNGGSGGSGAGFPFSGSAIITGSLLVSGNMSSSGHFVPTTTDIYDLGSPNLKWRSLYVSGSTIYLGDVQLKAQDGQFKVVNNSGQILPITGSFIGSFTGNASSATTASLAQSASYAINTTTVKTIEYFDTLTTFNGTRRWWAHKAFTISRISAFLIDASQGADVIIRVNKNGVSATTLTVPQNIKFATSTPSIVLSAPTTASQDYITVDITQVGTSQSGGYLTLVFEYQ